MTTVLVDGRLHLLEPAGVPGGPGCALHRAAARASAQPLS